VRVRCSSRPRTAAECPFAILPLDCARMCRVLRVLHCVMLAPIGTIRDAALRLLYMRASHAAITGQSEPRPFTRRSAQLPMLMSKRAMINYSSTFLGKIEVAATQGRVRISADDNSPVSAHHVALHLVCNVWACSTAGTCPELAFHGRDRDAKVLSALPARSPVCETFLLWVQL
jgi:hypothetical protein